MRQAQSSKLLRYLLFVTATAASKKSFVASFNSREDAIVAAEILKKDPSTRWQVLDSQEAVIVAEDPGT
jgi:hypothetical protein